MENILKTNFVDLPGELFLPSGTWQSTIAAIEQQMDQNNKQYILLTLSPVEACDDVDPKELADWVEDGNPKVVISLRIRGSERSQGAQLKRIGKLLDAENARALIGKTVYCTIPHNKNTKDQWQSMSSIIFWFASGAPIGMAELAKVAVSLFGEQDDER